jgi:hypothetical protein
MRKPVGSTLAHVSLISLLGLALTGLAIGENRSSEEISASDAAPPARSHAGAGSVLITVGAVWNYLDDGSELTAAWYSPGFGDSGRALEPAELGCGHGDEETALGYGSDQNDKDITMSPRHTFHGTDASSIRELHLWLLRGDKAVARENATAAVRGKMPDQLADCEDLAAFLTRGPEEVDFPHKCISSGHLGHGVKSIPGELHQCTRDRPDIGSDLELVEERAQTESNNEFTFAVTADMRRYSGPGEYDTSEYFRGALEAISELGSSQFMVSPGDLDPVPDVFWTITSTLGTSYRWYPVVGNHDLPGAGSEEAPGDNMAWLNDYAYGAVNHGPTGCPTTTYSFDYQNSHLVMLNEYCDIAGDDVTDGDVPDHLYNWLVDDLAGTGKEHVFVFGHEPAYPQPDQDNGRERHIGDSLDQYPTHRDRLWDLLSQNGVVAYICGHTHNYSAIELDGVWQLDAGHARGLGDTGARSTFMLIHVHEQVVTFQTYRDDAAGGPYAYFAGGTLHGARSFLPLVVRDQGLRPHSSVKCGSAAARR